MFSSAYLERTVSNNNNNYNNNSNNNMQIYIARLLRDPVALYNNDYL